MSEELQVPFFSTVRLRHQSGIYLSSLPVNFTHEGTSGQQVVGGLHEATETTSWVVRPPHRLDYMKKGSEFLGNGSVVRLQHVRTGRNLHGHTMHAPVSEQHEITCYGEEGLGDPNDDWIISTRDGGQLETGKKVTLQHVQTRLYLHSHDDRHFEAGGEKLQEVTGYNGDDGNNDWIFEIVEQESGQVRLHPFASISTPGGVKSFDTPELLAQWLSEEQTRVAWLGAGHSGMHKSLHSSVTQYYSQLVTSTSQCQAVDPSSPDFKTRYENLDSQLSQFFDTYLFLESDPRSLFADRVRDEQSPDIASHVLAHFCGAQMETTPIAIKGTFLALCFDQGISDRAAAETASLERLRLEKEEMLNPVKQALDGAREKIDSHIQHSLGKLAAQEKQFHDVVAQGKEELETIKRTYDQHMSLRASVEYWKRKARWNSIAAGGFGIAAAVIGAVIAWGLVTYANQVLRGTAESPPAWWEVGTMVIIATFGIWAVRVFVQLMYSNAHLAADAKERYTMLLTYLAMIRESVLPTAEEHKLLILQTLFRPGSTGVIKDDGAPSTWLDFIANKLGGK